MTEHPTHLPGTIAHRRIRLVRDPIARRIARVVVRPDVAGAAGLAQRRRAVRAEERERSPLVA